MISIVAYGGRMPMCGGEELLERAAQMGVINPRLSLYIPTRTTSGWMHANLPWGQELQPGQVLDSHGNVYDLNEVRMKVLQRDLDRFNDALRTPWERSRDGVRNLIGSSSYGETRLTPVMPDQKLPLRDTGYDLGRVINF
ncbi:hypothetical protein HYV86_00970 [Candidatus Woesearchaeota archaeon]|nr:hypothetical protein [Candidatus Woesearchaeota archaeon]